MANSRSRAWRRKKLQRKAIFIRDNFRCVFCNSNVSDRIHDNHRRRATIDHLVPQHREDSTEEQHNLVTCCRACNSKKGGTNWEVFVVDNYGLLCDQVFARIMERCSRKIIGWNDRSKLKKYIEGGQK